MLQTISIDWRFVSRALLCALVLPTATSALAADGPYHLLKEIPIRGEGICNSLTVDEVSHRLYAARGNRIDVVDLDRDRLVGSITDTSDVRGFSIAPNYRMAFASSGKAGAASLIELTTLRTHAKMKAGQQPGPIVFEPSRAQLFVFNERDYSVTIGEADDGDFLATLDLGGSPAAATTDPKAAPESKDARVFCSIADKDEVVAIDVSTRKVVGHWAVAPGKSPGALALDAQSHRLFIVCTNQMLVMMDGASGKTLGTMPIGGGPGSIVFDPITQFVLSANGDGKLVVAHGDSTGKLVPVQTLNVARGARLLAVDPNTHKIYVAAADSTDTPAVPIPGAFRILEFGM